MDESDRPLRLTVVTSDVHPDATTNARLLMDMSAALVGQGWRVDFVASSPSRKARQAGAEVPRQIDGVRIRRVWNPRVGSRGVISRLVNSAVVSSGVFLRLLFGRRPDVLLVDTVSPFEAPAVWLASVLRGYRYVYLATELYPDVAVALGYLGARSPFTRLWDWMNRRVYGRAREVIVIGPRLREKVARHLRGGIESPKLHVIHNWVDTSSIQPVSPADNWFRKEHGLSDKLVVLYSGNMGLSHDVETLIEAADLLREERGVEFVFIGGGPKKAKIEKMASDRNLPNVQFLPFQPLDVLSYSLSAGDLSVVTLEKEMDKLTIPSKLYPAMAAGSAILALMGEGSEVGEMVGELGIGIRVTQGDAEGMAAAIRELVRDDDRLQAMKRRAREVVVRDFDRSKAVSEYAAVLRKAAGR